MRDAGRDLANGRQFFGENQLLGRGLELAVCKLKLPGALVEDLVKTLDKFGVPAKEKNELLAILGPMKSDIVTR